MNGITSKNFFTTLTFITYAQIVALVSFAAIVIFLKSDTPQEETELSQLFDLIVPVLTIAIPTVAYFVYQSLMKKIDKHSDLKFKMAKYQTAVILRAGLIESAGLLGAAAAFITGQLYFLGCTALVVVMFFLLRPSISSAVEDLGLSGDEKSRLENPEEIIAERSATT